MMTPERHNYLRSLLYPFLDEDIWETGVGYQTGLAVSEDKNHVYVEADLPGLTPEDIEVTFEKGILWIRGEKKEEEEEGDKKKKYYRKALRSFSYRVHVPGAIDERKEPKATYKDGIMKVAFIKSSETPGKKISIQTR